VLQVSKSHEEQLREQIERYRDTENMHDLPTVFHQWTSNYVVPGLNEVFSVDDINLFYVEAFITAAERNSGVPVFASLGCGDGSVEIGIASTLLGRGLTQFRFICFDLSDVLLSRFRAALPTELADQFELVVGDLNARTLDTRFDVIMANHSLHHMVDLEGIFGTVYDNLADRGIFVTGDMIGRNGHTRWPEARLFVDFFWPFMSQRQRYNVLLHQSEPRFIDHDCSGEGFEGVRSQDVLPLILARGFGAWKFLGFGGMIDVFVERCFGPNFDVNNADDAFLTQRMGFMNEILLDAGLVKPTMMLAYFVKHPVEEVYYRKRSTHAAMRDTTSDPIWLVDALDDFARNPTDPDYVFKSRVAPPVLAAPTTPIDDAVPNATLGEMVVALRHAQNEAAAAQVRIAHLVQQIQQMENSRSWLATAPLRALVRMIRR
jgi:SAM-dependent methyltransferase